MKVFRIVFLFALLLCLSTPCFAYQFWFTVVDANIRQLDADSYRLRVDTDWGVNSLPPGSFLPSFNRFVLNGGPGVNRYNPTQNGYLEITRDPGSQGFVGRVSCRSLGTTSMLPMAWGMVPSFSAT